MTDHPSVLAADEQTDVEIDVERWARLVALVAIEEKVPAPSQVSLLFMGEAEIADLNEKFLGGSGPTDVLAFPIDGESARPSEPSGGHETDSSSDIEDGPPLVLGDVVVCPTVAARQAGEGGLDAELALLVVHGTLHLLGYDHAADEEATRMRDRERVILGRFDRLSRLDGVDRVDRVGGGV